MEQVRVNIARLVSHQVSVRQIDRANGILLWLAVNGTGGWLCDRIHSFLVLFALLLYDLCYRQQSIRWDQVVRTPGVKLCLTALFQLDNIFAQRQCFLFLNIFLIIQGRWILFDIGFLCR